jgi:hypothetical protein
MQNTVMTERMTLLIGVLPPVEALTLLRPYPPKAGKDMNKPPTTFATPRATSSLFALRLTFLRTFCLPSPAPKLLAATLLSKKPSRAMTKDVEKASEAYLRCETRSGKWTGNGLPLLLISPKISRPCLSHPNFHVNTAESTTIRNLSGTYAMDGKRGCKYFLSSLGNEINIQEQQN